MDTTIIKSAIQTGESLPKATSTGFTSLQVSLPLEARLALAELSKTSGFAQQEIVRQALESFLAAPVLVRNARTDRVDPVARAERVAAKAARLEVRQAARVARAQASAAKAQAQLAKAAQKASEAAAKAASLVS